MFKKHKGGWNQKTEACLDHLKAMEKSDVCSSFDMFIILFLSQFCFPMGHQMFSYAQPLVGRNSGI